MCGINLSQLSVIHAVRNSHCTAYANTLLCISEAARFMAFNHQWTGVRQELNDPMKWINAVHIPNVLLVQSNLRYICHNSRHSSSAHLHFRRHPIPLAYQPLTKITTSTTFPSPMTAISSPTPTLDIHTTFLIRIIAPTPIPARTALVAIPTQLPTSAVVEYRLRRVKSRRNAASNMLTEARKEMTLTTSRRMERLAMTPARLLV